MPVTAVAVPLDRFQLHQPAHPIFSKIVSRRWMAAGVLVNMALVSSVWLYPQLYLVSLLGLVMLAGVAQSLRPSAAWLWGTIVGTCSLAIAFHWAPQSIDETTNLGTVLSGIAFGVMIFWEAALFGLFALLVSWLWRRSRVTIWAAPLIWVSIEFLWPRIFPWTIAHTHLEFLPLMQLAEWTGTSGVSAAVVLGAILLLSLSQWRSLQRRERQLTTAALILTLLLIIGGQVRIGQVEATSEQAVRSGNRLRVAAIQVEPSEVDSVQRMQRLSQSLRDVDLFCWPESSLGHYHERLEHFRDDILTSEMSEAPNPAPDPTDGLSAPLLAGAGTYSDGGRDVGPYLNTAFLIDPAKSIIGRYVKRTLMPIGEYVPGQDWFPSLRDWAAVSSVRLSGQSALPVVMPSGERIGVLICYEDMSRQDARRTVAAGAQCLIGLINASSFRDVDTLEQHFRLAQLRSIENRRPLLRCAATGVTCLVAASGRIAQRAPNPGDHVLVATVPLLDEQTFYTRYGEWFSWLSVGLSICVLLRARAAPARQAPYADARPPQH